MPGGIGACKEPTPRLAVVQEGSDLGKRLVDRAAATDREQAVGVAGRGRDLVDPVARHLAPGAGGRQVELRPALAGDQERPLDSELAQQLRELTETPADDHVDSLARANSTK